MRQMVFALCYSPDWASHVRIEVHAIHATNPGARVFLMSSPDGHLDIPGCTNVDVSQHRTRFSETNIDTRFTVWTLYRLLLPELLPKEPRVLYIDADAIVNANLGEFWRTGLDGGALIAGVQDTGADAAMLADSGADWGEPYVNAGVTLLDLDGIRSAGIQDEWMRLINERYFPCHDQAVMNLTCRGRINVVGNEYNSSLSTGFAEEPKVMHYAGPWFDKPWCNARTRRADIWHKWAAAAAAA